MGAQGTSPFRLKEPPEGAEMVTREEVRQRLGGLSKRRTRSILHHAWVRYVYRPDAEGGSLHVWADVVAALGDQARRSQAAE
jgi:hypothetical protein